jgi:hypothetical protein
VHSTQAAPPGTCAPYPAGANPTFDTHQAFNFSAAITVPDIGIGQSAQTGWHTNAEVTYHVGSQGTRSAGRTMAPAAMRK